MSRLPNAPLLEVIFELRWDSKNREDLQKIQYLYGDLYAELRDKYPYRNNLVPPEVPLEVLINKTVHRFRKTENGYPLCQIGPGILTLNTIDDEYYWKQFFKNADKLLDAFIKVSDFDKNKDFYPILNYYDFFPFDFDKNNVNDYLNEKFQITYKQNFLDSYGLPNGLNIGFYYKIPSGNISVVFRKGKAHDKDGIVLQTKLHGNSFKLSKKELLNWLAEAHKFCSLTFKKLTKGELYESFK